MTENAPILLSEKSPSGVAILTLNRPDARNALSLELRQQLANAVADCTTDPNVRAIVITGGDKVFAGGADIKEFTTMTTHEMYLRHTEQYWQVLADCPKPIICAVNGYALGGGCELAMHGDIIVANVGAKFGQPEVKLGLMPGAGGTQRLMRAIGKFRAMHLILTGEMITAEQAYNMGLVSVLTDENAIQKAVEIAETIASYAPIAVAQIKEVATLGADMPLSGALALERKAFQLLFDTKDQKEGVNAFLEKRPAVYQGK